MFTVLKGDKVEGLDGSSVRTGPGLLPSFYNAAKHKWYMRSFHTREIDGFESLCRNNTYGKYKEIEDGKRPVAAGHLISVPRGFDSPPSTCKVHS